AVADAITDVSFVRLSFFLHRPSSTDPYTPSLHDALPISKPQPRSHSRVYPVHLGQGITAGRIVRTRRDRPSVGAAAALYPSTARSEEHTSELQSRENLVCRLLLEKKKCSSATSAAVDLRH